MKTYAIEFAASAAKEVGKLPASARQRVLSAINKLADEPRRGQVRPMVGPKSWRLRVGDYRIVHDIYDAKLVVLVLRVRHRRDAYRR